MANVPTSPFPRALRVSPAVLLAPFSFLQSEHDRTLGELYQSVGFSPAPLDEAEFAFRPAADLHEDKSVITIRIDLPGVDQQNVDVSVADDTIEVCGVKNSHTDTHDGDKYRSERVFGAFYRSFVLPFRIEAEKVNATLVNGVLTLTIGRPADPGIRTTNIAIRS